jgi:methylated-DNA-protein-cysteine methyltransferase related protein
LKTSKNSRIGKKHSPHSAYERVYRIVRAIPRGKVATYGIIAKLAGSVTARQVGYALHSLSHGSDVPWHRVINARGEISDLPGFGGREIQRLKLEEEKILFDSKDRVDLDRYLWKKGRGGRPAK